MVKSHTDWFSQLKIKKFIHTHTYTVIHAQFLISLLQLLDCKLNKEDPVSFKPIQFDDRLVVQLVTFRDHTYINIKRGEKERFEERSEYWSNNRSIMVHLYS